MRINQEGLFPFGQKILPAHFKRAVKLLRPVAVFARFPGRAQVMDRRGDRTRIGVLDRLENLAHAGKLRAHVPVHPGTDMALHAFDTRVRRLLVTGILRGSSPCGR